jgi:hypothetical protein
LEEEMTQVAISGFVNTWAPAFSSTLQRVDVRNIRQGGNDLLAAFPLALQAIFASSALGSVAAAVTGPFAFLARFFQILFSPFISFPLAAVSCAVKEGFYEESVKVTLAETTQFFVASQEESPQPVQGTIALQVGGEERHFILGNNIDWYVRSTVVDDGKRYWFHRLEADEAFGEDCREVEINGQRVRIKLEFEAFTQKFIERVENGEKHYYELGSEVPNAIRGTISVPIPDDQIDWLNYDWRNPPQRERHYFLSASPQEIPNGVKVKSAEQALYYDTGEELSSREPGSRTFIIDGVERHFASATYKRNRTLGLSTGLNALSDRFFGVSLLPTRLSAFAGKALTFANQYLSEVVRISLIVSGAVLFYFGSTAMAVGALAAVVYETLDHDLGVIPHKVSLFMEQWMPMISSMGLLIVGGVFSQILAAASLVMMIPSAQVWIHQKVSAVLRKSMLEIADPLIEWFAPRQGGEERPPRIDEFLAGLRAYPSLEECDAPFSQRKEMGRAEMDAILNGTDDEYELNPACFTHNVEPVLQLETNTDFNILMQFWDARTDLWLQSYPRLMLKLADDEKFIEFLRTRIPGARPYFFEYDFNNGQQNRNQQEDAARIRYRQDIDTWITTFAEGQNITKQQFVVNFIREQLQAFIEKLSGTRPIEGERWLLEDTIESVSQIIPFLLRPDTTAFDIENNLLHLGVDGGNYCALGMHRAASDVLESYTEPLILAMLDQLPPSERHEKEVMREYQKARLRAIQGFYSQATEFLRGSAQFRNTADDIHLYTFVADTLKRGLYPQTDEERFRFSVPHLLFSDTLLFPFRKILRDEILEHIPDTMNRMSIDRTSSFDGGPVLGRIGGINRQVYVDGEHRMLYLDDQDVEHFVVDADGEIERYEARRAPRGENRSALRIEPPHNKTLNYLRAWVQTNPQLTDLEKQELLNGSLALNAEQLMDYDNLSKWNRLFLNVLGVYRKKAAQPVESGALTAAAPSAAMQNPPPQLVTVGGA